MKGNNYQLTFTKNTYINVLILSLCFTIHSSVFSQHTEHGCDSGVIKERLLQEDTNYAEKQAFFEKKYRQNVKAIANSESRSSSAVYTIPVVVHIVHNGAALGTTANPTDATIEGIIAETTDRFRHTQAGAPNFSNPYFGIDTEIEFCLASADLNGNFTSGIVRYYDPVYSVGAYQDLSQPLSALAWDQNQFCNLFIVTDLTNGIAGVHLGSPDITVFDSNSFWSGLIAHELGHYFNLDHTFKNGCTNGNCLTDGDGVCDTPPKATAGFAGGMCNSPNNSCSSDVDDTSTNNPYRSTALGGMGDQLDMLSNYMDYTGSCWDAFTLGQVTRMRTDIDVNRPALKGNTMACSNSVSSSIDAGIFYSYFERNDICDPDFMPMVTINNYGSTTLTSMNIEVLLNGIIVATEPWIGSIPSGESRAYAMTNPITMTTPGMYTVGIRTSFPNGLLDEDTSNDQKDTNIEYFGGSSCQFINECQALNTSTNQGPGNMTVIQAVGTFPTANVQNVQICVTQEGDNSFSGETMDIIDESNNIVGRTNYGTDCGGPSAEVCFTPSLADYYVWAADGEITISFNPISGSINPIWCNFNPNQVCASIIVSEISVPSCVDAILLDNIIATGMYEVSDSILCEGSITPAETVVLRSNNALDFLPGFEVQLGAELDGDTRNSGCTN